MKLVADENMPLLAEFFSEFGDVVTLPGRHITAHDVKDADVLLVRSVTRVNRELLANSPVRFVGTATIGTDHLDLPALHDMGVTIASAPGCNARAVGEYVAAVLVNLSREQGWRPEQRVLGVVGLGNTGSWVVRLAKVLGFRVLGVDPAVSLPEVEMCTWPELLAKADIISLHVPLVREGRHSTWHLVNDQTLALLKPDSILVNGCRGEVIDNIALNDCLQRGQKLTVVLDVWEGEPHVMPELLAQVRWGTPHIAGYSQEGKWRGTEMIYQALCRHLGKAPSTSLESLGRMTALSPYTVITGDSVDILANALLHACPLSRDDANLRASLQSSNPAEAFDRLRRHYPQRREFPAHQLVISSDAVTANTLSSLGFRVHIAGSGLEGSENDH